MKEELGDRWLGPTSSASAHRRCWAISSGSSSITSPAPIRRRGGMRRGEPMPASLSCSAGRPGAEQTGGDLPTSRKSSRAWITGPAPESAARGAGGLDRHRTMGGLRRSSSTAALRVLHRWPREETSRPQPGHGRCAGQLSRPRRRDLDAAVTRRAGRREMGEAGRPRARAVCSMPSRGCCRNTPPLRGAGDARQRQADPREPRHRHPPGARHFYHHAGMAQLMEANCPDRVGAWASAGRSSRGTSRC